MKRLLYCISVILTLFPISITFSQAIELNQRKLALVIGNNDYLIGNLTNPVNDARAMKEVLEQYGFEVLIYENLDQREMKIAIDDFGRRLQGCEVGLFFYAGHGIQTNGYNYLIPIDAELQSEKQVEYDCVQADRVLALMEAGNADINIIILDACRNNPFERSWSRATKSRGLAFMDAPRGTLIAYATAPGSTASDGSGKNGLYTGAILKNIKIPDITILQMFQNVRSEVSNISGNTQTPWESTSLTGDFYFNRTIRPATSDHIENVQDFVTTYKNYPVIIDIINQDSTYFLKQNIGSNNKKRGGRLYKGKTYSIHTTENSFGKGGSKIGTVEVTQVGNDTSVSLIKEIEVGIEPMKLRGNYLKPSYFSKGFLTEISYYIPTYKNLTEYRFSGRIGYKNNIHNWYLNFDYAKHVMPILESHIVLSADYKIDLVRNNRLTPYILLGAGVFLLPHSKSEYYYQIPADQEGEFLGLESKYDRIIFSYNEKINPIGKIGLGLDIPIIPRVGISISIIDHYYGHIGLIGEQFSGQIITNDFESEPYEQDVIHNSIAASFGLWYIL